MFSQSSQLNHHQLYRLSERYKKNAQEQASMVELTNVPEGEFVINQLLCTNGGDVLVCWEGDSLLPTWEPVASIPAATWEFYQKQGEITLEQYAQLLDLNEQ